MENKMSNRQKLSVISFWLISWSVFGVLLGTTTFYSLLTDFTSFIVISLVSINAILLVFALSLMSNILAHLALKKMKIGDILFFISIFILQWSTSSLWLILSSYFISRIFVVSQDTDIFQNIILSLLASIVFYVSLVLGIQKFGKIVSKD